MSVVEIFLSAAIKFLLEKLTSKELLNFAKRERIPTLIKKWLGMLLKIEAVLTNAEEQQLANKAVQLWLNDLQDLAYDLDDLLDEFATEELRQKLDGLNPLQGGTSATSKVRAFPFSRCFNFGPRALMYSYRMRSKIDNISSRLETIAQQRRDLELETVISISAARKSTRQRTPTTSLLHVPSVCGRKEDKEEIVKFLLRDNDKKIGIISVVGMGGIGKTTLAQAVYNDEDVMKHFVLRAWVCVSEEFDIMRITKAILESVTSRPCDLNNLDKVQDELKKSLAGRKFLIVLDDVWNEDGKEWDLLKSSFSDGAQGSKVIVTTRHFKVASLMENVKNQHLSLQPLPFDDCWTVFSQYAFGNRSMDENLDLVEIGKRIVERCKGLPLSARALGGLLRCKETEDEWKDVLDSEWWEDDQILPPLRLSYHHLPAVLKPCFAYCSILPKDYEFEEEELVLLWMAQGFIQQGRGKKQLEDIAHDYFRELLSRSLFQTSSAKGNSKSFVMHDLINDLAQIVSGDLCFRLEDKLKDQNGSKNLERARHASYMQGSLDGIRNFESIFQAKRLRTFLPFSLGDSGNCYLGSNVPFKLFHDMRCVRALSLRRYNIYELPDSDCDMKHLRYLDLSFTEIETLPDWVQTLCNLQTLILQGCKKMKRLPKNMGNLINLRHLDLTDTCALEEMPLGIGDLENLQMLSNFVVTKDNGYRITELGKLRNIGGTLCLSGIQNVMDPLHAKGACIIEKKRLESLRIVYDAISCEMPNQGVEREVLHMLQPHSKLKELHIYWYNGSRFPTWLENPVFFNMVHIEIKNCTNCSTLPPLGQLKSLKKLYIQGMSSVKQVGREFYGQFSPKPFPDLDIMSFEDMLEWEDSFTFEVDEDVQPFPRVSQLIIKNCPQLIGKLPHNLPSLKVLEITKSEHLVVDFVDLAYPSLTSISVDGVELPFSFSMLSGTHDSSSLSSFRVKNISVSDSFAKKGISPKSSFQHLNLVAELKIENIQKLSYLPKELTCELFTLKELEITRCQALKTLLQKNNQEATLQQQQHLPALQRLNITWCPQLVSLFEETEATEKHEGVQIFMPRLESLYLWHCWKVEKLPRWLYMLTSLVNLEIGGCPKLVSFPETGFPPNLRTLDISACLALDSPLPLWESNNNLERLEVVACPSIKYLIPSSTSSSSSNTRRGGFPSSLKCIRIVDCGKLEALVSGREQKISIPSLEVIEISKCGNLKYLPDTLYNDSLVKLRNLEISGCDNLHYLPDGWSHAMTNLRDIYAYGWGNLRARNLTDGKGRGDIIRVVSIILTKAHFFTNLTTLRIYDITVGVHPSQWGLDRLTSLKQLEIRGPIHVAPEGGEACVIEVSAFPLDGMLLPTSLTILDIGEFPDLVRLSSKGFEHLSSLEALWLWYCPRLAYFPEGGLPNTLLSLDIVGYSVLGERCERGKGQYWPIISHIPCVDVWEYY